MRDEPIRLAMIGRILLRRWRTLAALTLLGALLGAGGSLLFSPGYQTTASVLLQGPREPDELLTEAQVATSSVVLDRAAARLRTSSAALSESVTSEVADGNVVDITATADSPERAKQVADRVAQEYAEFSAQLVNTTAEASAQVRAEQQEALRRQVTETNQRISELHAAAAGGASVESVQVRTQLEALRTGLSNAITTLEESDAVASRANVVVLGPAEGPSSPAPPTMPQLVAGGAVLAFLLGLLGHVIAARADRRLHTEPAIAEALGAPVLAGIDVPDDGADPSRFAWLLDDRPWREPPRTASRAELTGEVRYRRLLAKLRGAPGAVLRLAVLIADDDPVARQAVARLAAAAAVDGPVSVRTGHTELAQLVARTAGEREVAVGQEVDRTARTVLVVVEVSARRATVPDDAGLAGALVVLTSGSRTADDLVEIAGACADAGHEVVGAVVTRPAAPIDEAREPALVGAL